MTWIKTIPVDEAEGKLKKLYQRTIRPDGDVDNIMKAHSLRPHTMEGHMTIYKYVLHHPHNTLPKWWLEAVGVYVSGLNQCAYCFDHHFQGMRRLLNDESKSSEIHKALGDDAPENAFSGRDLAAMVYVKKLTLNAADVAETDIEMLRDAGWEDGEILEINQVAAYFSYANRTVLGLGVNTDGDVIGLSPNNSADSEDWSHN